MINKPEETKSLHELASGAGVCFIFGLGGYALMFLFRVLATRFLGAEDYGLFEMVRTMLVISMVFAVVGIPNGIVRYIPFYKFSNNISLLAGYRKFIFHFPLVFSILTALALYLLSPSITSFFDFPEKFTLLLRIISLAIPFRAISGILRNVLIAEKKVLHRSLSAHIIENLTLIIGVLISYYLHFGLLGVVIALFLAVILCFAFEYFIYKRRIKFPLSREVKYRKKEWIKFSSPLFLSGLSDRFVQWGDNIVIGKILSASALGVYSIAYSLSDFLNFFSIIFTTIFKPLISEKKAQNKESEITELYRKSSLWSFGLGLPLVIYFFIFGKTFIDYFFGSEFTGGYQALIIISTGIIFSLLIGPAESIILLHKKTHFLFWSNVLAAVANIALNIVLAKHFGITGVAVSGLICVTSRNFINYLIARRFEILVLNAKRILLFFLAGIVSFLPFFALYKILTLQLSTFMAVSISYFIFYFILSYVFKAISKNDKKILADIWRKFIKKPAAESL